MDKDHGNRYGWIDRVDFSHIPPIAGDPYFPEVHPHITNNLPEDEPKEEDPEEEPQEEDPEEEEYHPASEEESEEYHPALNEDEEDEDMGECYTPSPLKRKRPVLKKTARMDAFPRSDIRTSHFEGLSFNPSPHFEAGESSQAPPHNIPIPAPAVPTMVEFNRLADQVRRLEERERSNSDALQTLYHRMGASRTEANSLRAHNQVLSYRLEITESRLDAAEHRAQEAELERDLIRGEHDEIVRRFNDE